MIKIELIQEGKQKLLPLLLLADPSERMIDRYLSEGELYLLSCDGRPVCEAVVTAVSETVCELKNLACYEEEQGKGYASKLVQYLFGVYAERFQTMLVGTSDTMIPFYQRFGFVFSHMEPNFFTRNYPDPIWEDGVQCIDMTYLKKDLGQGQEI